MVKNPAKILEELKKYRLSQKISQAHMAEKLQTTQATISRIESGKQRPSKETLEKIKELITSREQDTQGFNSEQIDDPYFTPKAQIKSSILDNEGINYSYVVFEAYGPGGDLCKIKSLSKRKESIFIVADAVGHGESAASMSFALEYGFETALSTLNEDIISLHLLDSVLSLALRNTQKKWKGEPSIIIGTIEHKTGNLSFLNSGLPYPIQKRVQNKSRYVNEKRYRALNLKTEKLEKKIENSISISHGDAIIFYTDGVVDLLEENVLFTEFENASKLFKGDARAIAENLQRVIEYEISKKNIDIDDLSYMIISRKAKRKEPE